MFSPFFIEKTFYFIWKSQTKPLPLHSLSERKCVLRKVGVVVQLVRIPACHAGGRGFESRPYRFKVRSYIG